MPSPVVYLHIGSPKTGTTFLQNSLWDNRDVLAADGVLVPGRSRMVTGRHVGDLLKWRPAHELPETWERLADDMAGWSGRSVVLSQEHLHKTTESQFDALVDSLAGSRIEIILTVRDVARSVPAQWQSSVRQRYTWTLGEYAEAVSTADRTKELAGAARHFWRRQDAQAILTRFVRRLSVEQVRVVTVPPSGGDPDELWRRFCQAADVTSDGTVPGEVSHESLGAASAELMRRLNVSAPVEELEVADYKRTINHALSRHVLSFRRGVEPGLTLPERHRGWAEEEAGRMIDDIERTGVQVIGDLDDLVPKSSDKPYVDPEDLPAEELLEAAMAGIAGLAKQHIELREQIDEATQAASSAAASAADARSGEREEKNRSVGLERVLRRLQRGS